MLKNGAPTIRTELLGNETRDIPLEKAGTFVRSYFIHFVLSLMSFMLLVSFITVKELSVPSVDASSTTVIAGVSNIINELSVPLARIGIW